MKYLTNFISKSCIAVSLLLAITFSANAALIKHDIFVDLDLNGAFQLGSIEVELDDSLIGTGLASSFDGGLSLVELNIFGGVNFDFFDFEVIIDTDNLFAGIEFLAFDVTELDFVDGWSYQVEFDAFAPDFAFIDIFNGSFDLVDFGSVSLGEASVEVNEVSAPSSLALFSLALIALYNRRKMLKA